MEIEQTKEVKEIWYKKGKISLPVMRIPLEKLIYNKYNGRIKSIVKSFESGLGRKLDPENTEDAKIIQTFLFDSAAYRNEKTIQSLKDYGQQEVGIVTKDMVIIDGNRRASLLKKMFSSGHKVNYFKAIILPDEMKQEPLEIIKLETNYQMGVDNKVEYNPIEKYLRCDELVNEHKISIEEVAKLMAEKTTRINQWLSILQLMNEYLEYLKSPHVYTRINKNEGHFVDLHNYLNKYYAQNKNKCSELKQTYFDYIRLGLPVSRIRVIGNPNNNLSLFANDGLWNEFFEKHQKTIAEYKEPDFIELKKANPYKSNEDVYTNLDYRFRSELESELKSNLVSGEISIKKIIEKKSRLDKLIEVEKMIKDLNFSHLDNIEKTNIISALNRISQLINKLTLSI